MRFYTVEHLSAKRHKTPEGFLVCEDVPLARTGWMEYHISELELKPVPGTDVIRVKRTPEEVFAPNTLASFSGKPLVNDHPEDDVTPANWNKLSGGMILNIRQGSGNQDDLTIADVMVTRPDLIALVDSGEKTEVSVGYDCDYDEIGPGEYAQKNILVNHVALVEQGRCGPRCKIGDTKTKQETGMSYISTILHRAFKAKDASELDAIEKEIKKEKPELVGEKGEDSPQGGEKGDGPEEQHIHVHLGSGGSTSMSPNKNMGGEDDEEAEVAEGGDVETRLARIESLLEALVGGDSEGGEDKAWRDRLRDKWNKDKKDTKSKDDEESEEEKEKREKKDKEAKDKMKDDETIEGALEMEAPPGTEDRARKARDSSYLADAWQEHVALAEIIIPGARMPTFDTAARPAVTLSKLCGARAQLLERAYEVDKNRAVMDEINGNRVLDFKKMTCDTARTMVRTLALEIGRQNNAGEGFGSYAAQRGAGGGTGVHGKIRTPADLNKLAREQYKRAG